VPALAVSIPLLEVVLSILRRFSRNRQIFEAGRRHIRGRLLDRGLSPKNAVLTLYAICAVVALLALIASALHN
jgi:UDP-GlcNAc:undecaprenyl-phosphate/decaprenyl-phosphate GlcNAc-1-phosphate transferase